MITLKGLDGEGSAAGICLAERICQKGWCENWTGGNSKAWQEDRQEILGIGETSLIAVQHQVAEITLIKCGRRTGWSSTEDDAHMSLHLEWKVERK